MRRQLRAQFTTSAETPPPQLFCPECDKLLVYRQTGVNGVNPIERWPFFECRTCGKFEYRQRTRRLRVA